MTISKEVVPMNFSGLAAKFSLIRMAMAPESAK
jgi:hypothetical protein